MYFIRKYNAETPGFGVWSQGFSEDEIEKILFLEKTLKFTKAQVGSEQVLDVDSRNSKVAFLPIDQNTEWIWQRLGEIVPKANYDLFLKDISAIESIQYTIYDSREEQFYDWHFDAHPHYNDLVRKISLSIALNSEDEYEGGDLEIINNGSPDRSLKLRVNKGDIAFFDSMYPHKVHPVTKGTRKSLVAWILGKREG